MLHRAMKGEEGEQLSRNWGEGSPSDFVKTVRFMYTRKSVEIAGRGTKTEGMDSPCKGTLL